MIFECIMVVNAYDRACEGCDLTEAHQNGLVYLSLRGDERTDKEQCNACEGEEEGSDELQITFFQVFHNANFYLGARAIMREKCKTIYKNPVQR